MVRPLQEHATCLGWVCGQVKGKSSKSGRSWLWRSTTTKECFLSAWIPNPPPHKRWPSLPVQQSKKHRIFHQLCGEWMERCTIFPASQPPFSWWTLNTPSSLLIKKILIISNLILFCFKFDVFVLSLFFRKSFCFKLKKVRKGEVKKNEGVEVWLRRNREE